MKSYNSIDYYGDYWGIPITAFDKMDGSNLRFEYSHKRGFYKFGSRNVMIDKQNPDFGFAIDIFLNKYNEGLSRIFREKEYRSIQSFVCFAECLGTKSSFGQHDFGNDNFDVTLFDINQHKKGFIPPRQFVKDFGNLGIPRIVYEGNLNKEFVENVKNNIYGLSEGVIGKGVIDNKKFGNLYYCKIKTDDWFRRLREKDQEMWNKELKESKNQYS